MEKGCEQIVAALAILACGRAFLPVSAGQPDARIEAILRAAGAPIALTQPRIRRGRAWQEAATLIDVPDETPSDPPPLPPEPHTDPADLAYVIYTSGSTGAPKGVAMAHHAARNTVEDIARRFDLQPGTAAPPRGLWASSLEFDLSIFDLFGLLGQGGSLVIPPPDAARDPACYAALVQRHQVTVWNSVPAIAELMLQAAEQANALDSLRLIMLSGDWIPLALPPRLAEAAPQARIIALGGATEAAIWSVFHPIETIDPDWASIPYGRPLANQQLHVLGDDLQPCPLHVTGRLFIAGQGLALGYWNAPALTAARFVPHPETGERLYDTGDLAARLPNGDIKLIGREDTQVKIRGFRIELAEIENTLQKHPEIKNAAAIIKNNKIIACVQTDGGDDSLRAWAEAHLPDYMQPAVYVRLDALPLTANGKLDRRTLANLVPERTRAGRAPRNSTEALLCALVADILDPGPCGPEDDFFHLGGDSISAIRLVNRARAQGLTLNARDVFLHPVIADLAARADGGRAGSTQDRQDALVPEPVARAVRAADPTLEDIWPLTPLQTGLWYHAHCATEGDDPYLVQIRLILDGPLDPARLRRALDALLVRHAGLRVRFIAVENQHEPVQGVCRDLPVGWRFVDLVQAEDPMEEAVQIAAQDRADRLNPAAAPLIRATLIALPEGRHHLLVTQHHLLSDGWSSGIFMRDLFALYRADGDATALLPAHSPRPYLAWLSTQEMAPALEAWAAYLDGFDAPALVAPQARTDILYRQESLETPVPADLDDTITASARDLGVTRATLFQVAWGLLVSRLTGRGDICFGTVNSGRHAPVEGIEEVLGLLLTTVPLRLNPRPGESLSALMRRVQKEQAHLLDAAHAPLTAIHRRAGVPALFDTLFTFENYPLQTNPDPAGRGELPVAAIDGHNGNHYPLSLAVIPSDKTRLRIHYSAALFDAEQAAAVLARLVGILQQITRAPDRPAQQVTALLPGEATRAIARGQGQGKLPADDWLTATVTAWATRAPGAPAIIEGSGQTISYTELEVQANRFARLLISEGLGPEDVVALRLERSATLIAALLGSLKAGVAFLPLDPADPPARAAAVMADAGAKLLIGTPWDGFEGRGFDPAQGASAGRWQTLSEAPLNATERVAPLRRDHPAYVIYTSGSTGLPKGVIVSTSRADQPCKRTGKPTWHRLGQPRGADRTVQFRCSHQRSRDDARIRGDAGHRAGRCARWRRANRIPFAACGYPRNPDTNCAVGNAAGRASPRRTDRRG